RWAGRRSQGGGHAQATRVLLREDPAVDLEVVLGHHLVVEPPLEFPPQGDAIELARARDGLDHLVFCLHDQAGLVMSNHFVYRATRMAASTPFSGEIRPRNKR